MILVVDNAVEGGYMGGEIARLLPETESFNYPNRDGDPDLDGVDAVVIGGSEAGVYEEPDRPWITEQKEFVQEVIDREIPLLGICFGHQIINEALGGAVVDSGEGRANLIRASLGDDELFDGVESVVPVLHSDVVTETGDGMAVVGQAEYNEYFATRHRDLPIWTVQYHPEFTPHILPEYREYWEENDLDFEDSTATRTLDNFCRLCGVKKEVVEE